MCDATHDNSFGLVLTAINEVFKCIVYIVEDIIILFWRWLYDVVYDVKLPYPG